MLLLSNVRFSLYRGLLRLAVGGISGGAFGTVVLWFISWLRENPEEPAWIFAGTMLGLMLGIFLGSVVGFTIGLISFRGKLSESAKVYKGMHPTANTTALIFGNGLARRVMPGVRPPRMSQSMKRLIVTIIIVLLILPPAYSDSQRSVLNAAVSESLPIKEPASIPRNTRFVLHRFLGGAWGGEYELRILATGKVSFRGHIGLRKDSVESGRITWSDIENLLAAARADGFFSLRKNYPIHAFPTDAPIIKLSVTTGRQFKSVRWQGRFSEEQMTDEERRLARLEQLIIKTAGAEPWIQRHCTLEGLPNNGMHPTPHTRKALLDFYRIPVSFN